LVTQHLTRTSDSVVTSRAQARRFETVTERSGGAVSRSGRHHPGVGSRRRTSVAEFFFGELGTVNPTRGVAVREFDRGSVGAVLATIEVPGSAPVDPVDPDERGTVCPVKFAV
jgi:hypothetical protein